MQNTDGKYSILFVDDEEKALKYFSRLFSDEFTILTAPDTEKAKAILQENHQDIGVLITDQRMPEETGVTLLKHAKDNYPNIIRLLTTAYSDLSDAIEAVNKGEILRYITKPWDIDLLRLELRHALRFFLLKNERDVLLKEKLNIRLRLIEINKARDLIVFATSLNKMRNSQKAIFDFLQQAPVLHSSPTFDLERLDEWSLSKVEIIDTLKLIKEVTVTFSSIEDFNTKQVSTTSILKECCDACGIAFDSAGSLPDLSLNSTLFNLLIQQLMDLLKTLSPAEPVKLSAQVTDSNLRITLSSKNGGWPELSILNIPSGLLSSFIICYHHNGTFRIGNGENENIYFQLDFPLGDAGLNDEIAMEEVLDEILSRFEFWY